MRKYRVHFEGFNCLLNVDKELAKYGFFTTRFVYAEDSDRAAHRAKEMLRLELAERIKNGPDDLPVMLVEGIEELSSFGEVETHQPGFAWYREDEQRH